MISPPTSLHEWGVIWRIVFPLVREPAALAIFAYHWNDPFWPLLMARQQEIHTPPLALYYLQVGRHGNSRYGRSQTGGQV